MILIADGGSTNTEWCLTDGINTTVFKSTGINPFFHKDVDIRKILIDEVLQRLPIEPITDLFFYGAGCVSPKQCLFIKKQLYKVFGVENIEVYSDLEGAARGMCGRHSGIVCILGTGSNSCYWNGLTIVDNTPPLGYILGDEGSGSYIGRRLVSNYYKGLFPDKLATEFRKRYPYTKETILNKVYKGEFPNRFLASFAPFASEYIADAEIAEIVNGALLEFIDRNIIKYPYKTEQIYFIGSIASAFSENLRAAALKRGLQLSAIESSPMRGLIKYHLEII